MVLRLSSSDHCMNVSDHGDLCCAAHGPFNSIWSIEYGYKIFRCHMPEPFSGPTCECAALLVARQWRQRAAAAAAQRQPRAAPTPAACGHVPGVLQLRPCCERTAGCAAALQLHPRARVATVCPLVRRDWARPPVQAFHFKECAGFQLLRATSVLLFTAIGVAIISYMFPVPVWDPSEAFLPAPGESDRACSFEPDSSATADRALPFTAITCKHFSLAQNLHELHANCLMQTNSKTGRSAVVPCIVGR